MLQDKNNRRDFIKKASLIGAASMASLDILASPSAKKIRINEGDVILFQGDSITDAGRKKDNKDANSQSALGTGYSLLAAAELLKSCAGKKVSIYNRGISGNKVFQLADRWDVDCLNLKPDILSILIGVNDFWHTLDGKYDGTVTKYKEDFRNLLTRTKDKLPAVKLIIGEPFAVSGVRAVDQRWYPAFDDYRVAAREMADLFGASFIPYQSIFDKAQKTAPGSYWTGDGVHPSVAGGELMAKAWLEMVKTG